VGTKISYKIISVTLTVLIVLGGIAVIISAFTYALGEAWNFISGLAESDTLYDILDKVVNPISGLLGDREGAAELEAHIGEAVSSMLSSLLSGAVGILTAFVTSVPRVLVFVLVTVIASIYFSLDLENINSFVKKRLPSKICSRLVNFKAKFLSSLLKYLRSYLIIMLITFIIMLFGFLIIGVKYSVLFAFIVALLDALPLIGVGTVLVPWSIYNIIFGEVRLGVGLAVLFIIHAVLREFIEPKIVGKNLGIHPIVSLLLLYAGYFIFGFLGLLLIPLISVIINILINKDDTPEVR
jgi:sporulation integral membrane protein YtvI